MAFTASDMQSFSRRVQRFMINLQAAREEAARLNDIFRNESASGVAPAWKDTEIATAAEHRNAMLYLHSFLAFHANVIVEKADRTLWITPFLQINP